MNVSGLSTIHPDLLVQGSQKAKQDDKTSFNDLLMEALHNVSQLEKTSEKMTNDFIAGTTDNIHSVLIAAEKASLSLELLVEVRNRALEAYNEIMRMQV